VFTCILIIALLNLGLGFAVALHLGNRHARLRSPEPWLPERPAPAEVPSAPSVPATPPAPAAGAAQAAIPAVEAEAEPAAEPPTGGTTGASSALLANLQTEVDHYQQHLADTDDALRSHVGMADAAAIEACLSSLMEATNEYLQKRQEAHQGFEAAHADTAEFQDSRNNLQQAVQLQDEQVRRSRETIRGLDVREDVAGGGRQMFAQTSKLLDVNHRLRDTLDEVRTEIAGKEQRLDAVDAQEAEDPLTGVSSRAAIEVALSRWKTNNAQRQSDTSAALVDLDNFTQVNERFGQKAGDKVLRAVGQLLAAERQHGGTVARVAGQRFFLLFPDTDIRAATNAVERIRQTVELIHFRYGGEDLRLTVSCAVTEVDAEDNFAMLTTRTETTLREAKRYGRNRTFLHEGKYPTPVVPPNFALAEKHIEL
jgi:diguanylate cyclase (GGDEF)-like protein